MTTPGPMITAPAGSRLEQLAAEYAIAKPAADEAKARLEMITDAIKVELCNAAPGLDRIDFTAPDLEIPLRLKRVSSWRLDSKLLKAELPEMYVRYAKKAVYWDLRAVTSRGVS
jgi:hypothetical protein